MEAIPESWVPVHLARHPKMTSGVLRMRRREAGGGTMQNEPNNLSKAVILFLGFGSASSPRRDRTRLVQEFGAAQGTELESQVASLLDEIGGICVDWST